VLVLGFLISASLATHHLQVVASSFLHWPGVTTAATATFGSHHQRLCVCRIPSGEPLVAFSGCTWLEVSSSLVCSHCGSPRYRSPVADFPSVAQFVALIYRILRHSFLLLSRQLVVGRIPVCPCRFSDPDSLVSDLLRSAGIASLHFRRQVISEGRWANKVLRASLSGSRLSAISFHIIFATPLPSLIIST
jgi:hypothetical protein